MLSCAMLLRRPLLKTLHMLHGACNNTARGQHQRDAATHGHTTHLRITHVAQHTYVTYDMSASLTSSPTQQMGPVALAGTSRLKMSPISS